MMLGSILHEVKTFVNKHDDDLIDRYNHRYTVMILAVFIFLIASKQYFGEPIIWYLEFMLILIEFYWILIRF